MHVLLALRGGNTQIKRFIGNSISYSPSLWENTAPGLCSPSPTAFGVRKKKGVWTQTEATTFTPQTDKSRGLKQTTSGKVQYSN